jgi:hypothetical protein
MGSDLGQNLAQMPPNSVDLRPLSTDCALKARSREQTNGRDYYRDAR